MIEYLTIIENSYIGDDYYRLVLSPTSVAPTPGQFLNIRITKQQNLYDPFLRRPFSVFHYDSERIEVIYKIVGKGTELLKYFKPNEKLDVIGPLGKPFSIEDAEIYIIGGGTGIAPLFFLFSKLKYKVKIKIFLGTKSKNFALWLKNLFAEEEVYISTEDGSYGKAGNVIELFSDFLNQMNLSSRRIKYYAAGPYNMLKKLYFLSKEYKIEGEMSLEKRLLCGLGSCLACVIKTVEGNKRVCKDGPVFNSSKIIF